MMDPTQLEHYRKQARVQQEQARMMADALKAAMLNPHSIEQIFMCATGATRDEHGRKLICIGKLDGSRIDVFLNDHAIADLIDQLEAAARQVNGNSTGGSTENSTENSQRV